MLPPLHTTATRRPAKRPGGHAGDQQRLVAGVHVPGPVFGGELFTVLPHLVEILPVRYHLRAERPDGLHLPRIGRTRYADEGVRTVKLGRVRDRLPVIAGGRGDQPGRAGRRVERGDEVDPTAHLERADRLVVLVLDPHLRAGRGIQRPVPVQRGAGQVRGRCGAMRRRACSTSMIVGSSTSGTAAPIRRFGPDRQDIVAPSAPVWRRRLLNWRPG